MQKEIHNQNQNQNQQVEQPQQKMSEQEIINKSLNIKPKEQI